MILLSANTPGSYRPNKVKYNITWKFLPKTNTYNVAINGCNLCFWEKFFIICKPNTATLNTHSEFIPSCGHGRKLYLSNYKQ